jgi:hypothetical protein
MNRAGRREQLRDWRRLTWSQQAGLVAMYGVDEVVPEALRAEWDAFVQESTDAATEET